MKVEIQYYRFEGWFIRSVKGQQILHSGFDTKAEAEEFAVENKYEVV